MKKTDKNILIVLGSLGVGVGAYFILTKKETPLKMGGMGGGISDIASDLTGGLTMPSLNLNLPDYGGVLKTAMETPKTIIDATGDQIKKVADSMGGFTSKLSDSVIDFNKSLFGSTGDLLNKVTSSGGGFVDAIQGIPTGIIETWKAIFYPVEQVYKGGGELARIQIAVANSAQNLIGSLSPKGQAIIAPTSNIVQSAVSKAKETSKASVSYIAKNIERAQATTSKLTDNVQKTIGIKNPLKPFG